MAGKRAEFLLDNPYLKGKYDKIMEAQLEAEKKHKEHLALMDIWFRESKEAEEKAKKAKTKLEISHVTIKKNKSKPIRRRSRNARSSRKHTLDSQESEALRTGREGSNVESSGVLEGEEGKVK